MRDAGTLENTTVLHLIEDGFCSISDMRKSSLEAEKLLSGRKALLIHSLEQLFKAVSDRNRITILALLKEREMCVCEIMAAMKTSQPTTSRNINMLERVGLVIKSRKGKWAFYRSADSPVIELITSSVGQV